MQRCLSSMRLSEESFISSFIILLFITLSQKSTVEKRIERLKRNNTHSPFHKHKNLVIILFYANRPPGTEATISLLSEVPGERHAFFGEKKLLKVF